MMEKFSTVELLRDIKTVTMAADRQPEAGARALGREERFGRAAQHFRFHALALVVDADADVFALRQLQAAAPLLRWATG